MRIHLLAAVAFLSVLPACFQFKVAAQAGYAQMAVDGDLGYVSGATTASIDQDVKSAFGLGDDQAAPYVRLSLDTGVPQLAVSAFTFEDEGSGTLQANFGSNPLLVAGAPVRSDLDLTNAKASYAFEIGLGPVSISPGIGVDYFDMNVSVRDQIGIATETVDLNAPVPIAFVRGELDLGVVGALVEIGYSAVDVDDIDGSLLDVELQALYYATPLIDVFVGYRLIELTVDGLIDDDTFDTDLRISGFMIGGGVRF